MKNGHSLRIRTQLAGIAHETWGLIGSTPGAFCAPRRPSTVTVAEGRLCWKWGDGKDLGDTMGALDRFIRVTGEQAVLGFARRYGPLFLCKEHSLPASHPFQFCMPALESESEDGSEPLEAWYQIAAYFRAMVDMAISLANGDRLSTEQWGELLTRGPIDPKSIHGLFLLGRARKSAGYDRTLWELSDPPDPEGDRLLFMELVNQLVSMANIYPRLVSVPGGSGFDLQMMTTGATFSLLTTQLMLIVAGGVRLDICSGCAWPYAATRKVPRERRGYCKDCGHNAASRDSYYRKRRRDDKPTRTREW